MKVKRRTNVRGISQKLLSLVASLFIASSVQAQTIADSPCDINYYESLKSRAWLEAQREITQNQNLIFKPDSVLEYTCFDQHLNVLADQALNMFSETTRWGTVLANTSMDNALQNLVGTPIASYINSNFETSTGGDYDLLGGRAGTVPGNGAVPPMDSLNPELDYPPENIASDARTVINPTPTTMRPYTCDIMNRVWQQAKCMDFIQAPNEDGFFTFASYAADDDKRFLPARCPGVTSQWQENIALSSDDETTPWEEDSVKAYYDAFLNDSCTQTSVSRIETGIVVKRLKNPSSYDEKICLAPGCYYDPASDRCRNSTDIY